MLLFWVLFHKFAKRERPWVTADKTYQFKDKAKVPDLHFHPVDKDLNYSVNREHTYRRLMSNMSITLIPTLANFFVILILRVISERY